MLIRFDRRSAPRLPSPRPRKAVDRGVACSGTITPGGENETIKGTFTRSYFLLSVSFSTAGNFYKINIGMHQTIILACMFVFDLTYVNWTYWGHHTFPVKARNMISLRVAFWVYIENMFDSYHEIFVANKHRLEKIMPTFAKINQIS